MKLDFKGLSETSEVQGAQGKFCEPYPSYGEKSFTAVATLKFAVCGSSMTLPLGDLRAAPDSQLSDSIALQLHHFLFHIH